MIYNTNIEQIHKEIPGKCWICKDRSYKFCDLSREPCSRTAPICKPVRNGHCLITGDW